MSDTAENEVPLDRPAFMVVLGLLPPYDVADIHEAYREKARTTHPDQGGDPAEFIRLKEAYDQAVAYATFRVSRRVWIGTQVELHLRQEELIAEVLRRGGRVEIERDVWMEKTWGDGFPLLAERLRHIYVRDMSDGDEFLAFLARHQPAHLVGLDVAGSRVSADGLSCLAGYEILHWLDLSGTSVDAATLKPLLSDLPSLEWLNVKNTGLGWWGRRQLQHDFPRLRVVTETPNVIEPGNASVDLRKESSRT